MFTDNSMITDLSLDSRTIGLLHSTRIYAIADLLRMSRQALLGVPGIGTGTLDKIETALFYCGLSLEP